MKKEREGEIEEESACQLIREFVRWKKEEERRSIVEVGPLQASDHIGGQIVFNSLPHSFWFVNHGGRKSVSTLFDSFFLSSSSFFFSLPFSSFSLFLSHSILSFLPAKNASEARETHSYFLALSVSGLEMQRDRRRGKERRKKWGREEGIHVIHSIPNYLMEREGDRDPWHVTSHRFFLDHSISLSYFLSSSLSYFLSSSLSISVREKERERGEWESSFSSSFSLLWLFPWTSNTYSMSMWSKGRIRKKGRKK